MIQLISLRFNYKRKSPSYPSPLDRGSTLPNKLPLVSQESLNYSFYFSFIPLFPLSSPSPPSGLISLSPCSRTCLCFLFRNGFRMGSNYLHHWFPALFGFRRHTAKQCLLQHIFTSLCPSAGNIDAKGTLKCLYEMHWASAISTLNPSVAILDTESNRHSIKSKIVCVVWEEGELDGSNKS